MLKILTAAMALTLIAPVVHAAQGHAALAAGTISPNVPVRSHSRDVSTHVTVFRHPNGEIGYRVRFRYSGSGVGSWPTAPDGSPLGTPPGFTPNLL